MMRAICLLAFVPLLVPAGAAGQDAIAGLPNLVPNGGFESGTRGWRVTIGPWGRGSDPWVRARGIVDVVADGAFAGAHCLRLDARKQPNEVDVSSQPLPVEPGKAYLLASRVRQLAGDGGYKVVLDWMDADGKHLAFANDWRGGDRPKAYAFHGGVFAAPDRAARVVVLLGVAKGVACLFDDIRLSPLPASPGQAVPDGEGTLDARLPRSVRAGGFATFRLVYRAGPHGLPAGGAVEFRRSNVNPRWSPPQASDPKAPGYVTAKASNGATCIVQPGGAGQVPCVTRVTVVYPALAPNDTVSIVYGDTSGGGAGARVQPTPERDIRFIVGTDGNADGRALDLPDSPPVAVVPGPFARLGVIAPAVVEAGKPFAVTIEARDRLGNVIPDYAGDAVFFADGARLAGPLRFGASLGVPLVAKALLRRPGVRVVQAASAAVLARQTVLVTLPAARPDGDPPDGARVRQAGGTIVLENRRVRLLFPKNAFGYGVAFLEARAPDRWKRVAAFRSLGELRTGRRGEAATRTPLWLSDAAPRQAAGSAGVVFTGRLRAGGTTWRAEVRCSLEAAAQHATLVSTVIPEGRAYLRAFYAPVLLAGDGTFGRAKAGALFPGLEYLTADEVSSGDYGSVPPLSERSVPHPFKVTMPFMAVTGDDACAMLFWDPRQTWDGRHRYPAARFESPERREDRADHVLALFAPSVPQGLPENAAEMLRPVAVESGKPLTLTVSVAALTPASEVTAAARYWFEVHGVPDAPAPPRSWSDEQAMLTEALVRTAWDPGKKGWHNALADPWGASYSPDAALLLWAYARANPQAPTKPDIEARLADAWGAAGGSGGFDLAFHRGDAAAALSGLQAGGEGSAYGMTPEGAYAYHPHAGNQTFTQANAKSIGRDGEVNVGTCVMGLEPLMRAAYLTGDPMLVQYGEKGLAYLDRFRRPQGAENWEVPLACPNLRASALALRCYLYGYFVTGKDQYLRQARYWAWTGLPFIYVWNAAERPTMRYASISVMGTSLYTGGWFGNAVQWVGLVYADAIRELAPYDREFPWANVADGLLISAMQQQKTAAAPCGHLGMYPDSYSPVKGDETYHWCLSPQSIGHLVNALHGLDMRASASVVRVGDRTVHIISAGRIADAAFADGTLRFTAQYLPDLPHEIVIARVEKAEQVLVDGSPLPGSDLRGEGSLGWQQTPYGFLRLRLSSPSGAARVELRGCSLMAPEAPRDVTAIANGDFEAGLLYWTPNPPERCRVVQDAHGGSNALELDAVGSVTEVQCGSRPMRVEAGGTYELSAWVKATAGAGDYKVTIDWTGSAGHVAYSNDWQGTNHPGSYTLHGGTFVAPAGAERAAVILGVRAGSRYAFDDVSLRLVK